VTAPTTTLPSGERITVPTNQSELEELLADQKRVQAVVKQGDFATMIQNYARAVAKADVDIKRQVNEQVQASLADFLKENYPDGTERPNLTPRQVVATGDARNHTYNPRAMGAALDKDFTGPTAVADYFNTIWHNTNRTADVQAKLTRIRNAFSSTVPSEGGFLIP